MNIALHGEIHCIGLRRLYFRLCTQTNISLDVMQNCAVRKDACVSRCMNCTSPSNNFTDIKIGE